LFLTQRGEAMSGENQGKVIFGRDEICKAYNIGRRTFRWLIEQGAPIKMTDGRYFVHRESMENFILLKTLETEKSAEEPKRKRSGKA